VAKGKSITDDELIERFNELFSQNPVISLSRLAEDLNSSVERLRRLKAEGKIVKLPAPMSPSAGGKLGALYHKKNRTGWRKQNDLTWKDRVRADGSK